MSFGHKKVPGFIDLYPYIYNFNNDFSFLKKLDNYLHKKKNQQNSYK